MAAAKNELKFYGDGVARLVHESRKLVTVRADLKPYENGELVEGHFVGDSTAPDNQAELRILHQEKQPLKDVLPGILLLDGYLNADADAAAADLPNYYSDIDWSVATPAAWTLFMLESHFQGEGTMDKYLLQNPEVKYEDGYAGLLRDRFRFHYLFLSYYFWLVDHHGYKPEQYPAELLARELITPERVPGMLELLALADKEEDEEQEQWLMHHFRIGDVPEELGF